jgi:hypothetical protein
LSACVAARRRDAVIVTLAVDTGFKYMSVSPFADLG